MHSARPEPGSFNQAALAAMAALSQRLADEEYIPLGVARHLVAGACPLRAWRKHRGLTLEQLAELSGVAVPLLYELENGHRAASLDLHRKLARILGAAVDN